jgi:rod shape-determining protein MreC
LLGAYQNAARGGFLSIDSDSETAPNAHARVDLVSYAAQRLVYYPQRAIGGAADSVASFFAGLWNSAGLAKRNQELEALAAEQGQYRDRIVRLESEIVRLRGLAGLPEYKNRVKVSADIVGYFPADQRISLNVGSLARVRPGDAVVAASGLVGQVIEVSPSGCFANLLTHPDFSVGARVVRNGSQEVGIANGQGSAQLLLNLYNETADIRDSDAITTSGLSEVYPEGIPVGAVTRSWFNKNLGIRQALVLPAANFAKIRQVVVLTR